MSETRVQFKDGRTTLTGKENALVGVFFAVGGGKFILRHQTKPYPSVDVINDAGEVIGSAHRIYTNGWAVETGPYAGFVSDDQIIWRDEDVQTE